jgi:hypothetical protein
MELLKIQLQDAGRTAVKGIYLTILLVLFGIDSGAWTSLNKILVKGAKNYGGKSEFFLYGAVR